MTGSHDEIYEAVRRLADANDPRAESDQLFAERDHFLVPARSAHANLQAAALDRWSDAFDWLELLLLASSAVVKHHEAQLFEAVEHEDWGFAAMHSIFWSGHLLAGEVLSLLRAGYSSGALARWRALHEVATRGEFIVNVSPDQQNVGRRFLEHESFRHRRELGALQGWLRHTSPAETISRQEMRALVAMDDEVLDRYDQVFRGEYGWAHADLLDAGTGYTALWESGRRMRGPIFADLEEAVFALKGERLWFQLLYVQASAAVHGSHRSFVTITDDEDAVIHDGPDLEALASSPAGEATAQRISDLTWVHVVRADHQELGDEAVEADFRLVEAITDIRHRAVEAFGVPDGATE